MESSPYLLFDKVGPWEDETRNPFMDRSSAGNTPELMINSGPRAPQKFEKLPLIKNIPKKPQISYHQAKKHFSTSKDKSKIDFDEKNLQIKEKTKKNFLLPRRKQNKTIHIQELQKKMRLYEPHENDPNLSMREENGVRVEKTHKPILRILAHNPFKLKLQEKTESPTQKMEKNLEYFTPNISNKTKASCSHKKHHVFKEKSTDSHLSDDIYVKGAVINNTNTKSQRIIPFSIHTDKRTQFIEKQNENAMKNIREEAIKIKIEHLKKIEKNSTHFLKYFLLKYDEDVEKKKKFMHSNKKVVHF